MGMVGILVSFVLRVMGADHDIASKASDTGTESPSFGVGQGLEATQTLSSVKPAALVSLL